jgi:putative proteasome-type protease
MTYCAALFLREGLVFLSDTRTNAGLDNISNFSKMHVVRAPGDRMMTLLTAGNLAISQSVMSLLQEGMDAGDSADSLLTVPTMFRAAQLVGNAIRQVHATDGPSLEAHGVRFDVSFILGGQIAGRPMRLFEIYAAGNFIEATTDRPFLQIGEHKYGKPILDRVLTHDSSLADGVKLVLISMDSTLRSNLTVGMPIDLLVQRRDTLAVAHRGRITEEDDYFAAIRRQWSEALRMAYQSLPNPAWLT